MYSDAKGHTLKLPFCFLSVRINNGIVLYNKTMQAVRVSFLIIGNEILSGRTMEKNLSVLAGLLNAHGLRLSEARVVRDEMTAIVTAVNALRAAFDYVFTSGGIGPTHDDITTDAIAEAFAVPVIENEAAVEKLSAFYISRGLPFTAARRRMARTPSGARIVPSAFPGAPAYRLDNVIVCAGVPAIFNMMATAAVAELPAAPVCRSSMIEVRSGETTFSEALAALAAAHPAVEIGCYPREDEDGFYCHIIFSAVDGGTIARAYTEFTDWLRAQALEYREESGSPLC